MKSRYCQRSIESEDSTLLQYESLRSQVLEKQRPLCSRSLGLALFIRKGMLAWVEICHKCIPINSTLDQQQKTPLLADETKSELIKIMANITLFNLQEAMS